MTDGESDRSPEIPEPVRKTTAEDYRTLLERVPAIVFIAEPQVDGKWRYVSPWIESILGFTVDEWLSDSTLWSRQLHPADRDKAIRLEEETSATFDSEPKAVAIDYRMLHKDGHVVWIRDESIMLPDENGQPLWYGLMSDVTEAKQTEIEIERQAAATTAVARLGSRALKRLSLAELFEEACQLVAEVLHVDATFIAEAPGGQPPLELQALHGLARSDLRLSQGDPDIDELARHALLSNDFTQVFNWDTETRFKRPQMLAEHGIRSSLCVPIGEPEHRFGVFGVLSTEPRSYPYSEAHFLRTMATVVADAVERQRAEDDAEHRALHDSLTGLPNRILFLDRVEQALERLRRHRKLAAALFIDVDHFKHINDTLGHHAGNELLVGVSARLRETVRPTDTVARFGGDEFGLLLDDITSERDAIATAERIAGSFARPFLLEAGSHFITLSIGIALTDGHEPASALIDNADKAMYRAKESGRAHYEMFDEDMRVRAIARMRLETDLRRALDQHDLRLTYQPLVRLGDQTICGAAALLRWDHQTRGTVPPADFIPVAEESGMIDRIGQWALRAACIDAAHWTRARPDAAPIPVHVKVSATQLANARLADAIDDSLAASGLSAGQLLVEVSESALLEGSETSRRTLTRLESSGVGIVVDDFGAGRSSLSHLSVFPLRAIKLSPNLIANLTSASTELRIAKAAIAMAGALGLEVIATEVDTPEQAQALASLGCVTAQGHLFSGPTTATELTAMLVNGIRLRQTTD